MNWKSRTANYCNLKLLLIFFVTYGHLIEPYISNSDGLLFTYKLIYTTHMPLFLFLSGLFIKGKRQAFSQAKHAFLLYAVCQSSVLFFCRMFSNSLSFFRPYWHLWYLFSLGCMAALAFWWYQLICYHPRLDCPAFQSALLLLSILFACMAGNIPWIGRNFSLSRTVAFLPYFLAGVFCPRNICWKRYQIPGLAAFLGFLALFHLQGRKIPTSFYYQAEPYGALPPGQGMFYRLLCYAMAACFGFFLLSVMPDRRFSFSKIGANTLEIYLLHAPAIKALEAAASFAAIPAKTSIRFAPLSAAYLVFFLYKAFQWKNPLYSILFTNRRRQNI